MPLTFLMLMKRISLDEIFEFRMMLEAGLASLAAARASGSEVRAMTSQIETMTANLDDNKKDEYLVAEYEFHNCIARAATACCWRSSRSSAACFGRPVRHW